MLSWSFLVPWLLGCSSGLEDTADSVSTSPQVIGALEFHGDRPRNVLVLTLDTVRKDYLGRYGDHQDTPWLDDMMDRSVVLEEHRSCANWTIPAVICLYAGQTTVDLRIEPISSDPLAPNYKPGMFFAPAWLRDRGYDTWMVTANGALPIWLSAEERVEGIFDHGFEGWWWETDAKAARVAEATLDQIDSLSGESPWWGHVQFFDPHSPYDAPESYLDGLQDLAPIDFDLSEQEEHDRLAGFWHTLTSEEQALIRAHIEVHYTAEMRYLDDQLALFWDGLEQRGVLDDTLVLVWTDHGEQFFEHGFYGHDVSMYREEVDLGIALWARNLVPASWTGPTRMVDLLPTMLEVLGEPLQEDFTGSVIGTASEPRSRFSFRYKVDTTAWQALDYDGRRLIYDWTGRRTYFESREDPAELVDAYDPADPRVAELEVLMADETDRILDFLPHLTAVGHRN